jgi:hypothetical protein
MQTDPNNFPDRGGGGARSVIIKFQHQPVAYAGW